MGQPRRSGVKKKVARTVYGPGKGELSKAPPKPRTIPAKCGVGNIWMDLGTGHEFVVAAVSDDEENLRLIKHGDRNSGVASRMISVADLRALFMHKGKHDDS